MASHGLGLMVIFSSYVGRAGGSQDAALLVNRIDDLDVFGIKEFDGYKLGD